MIVSLSLPDSLMKDLDTLIARRGYRGRSEAVRVALAQQLDRERREDELSGTVNAIVVLGYQEKAERALTEVRHGHNDLVQSMLHAHTVKGRCATVLLGAGPAEKVRRFIAELRGLRDVDSVEVTLLQ